MGSEISKLKNENRRKTNKIKRMASIHLRNKNGERL